MAMAASFGGASNFSINNSTFTHVAGSQHNYNIGDPSDFDVISQNTGAMRPNDVPNGTHPLPPQQAPPTLDSSNHPGIEAAPETPSRHRPYGRQRQRESRSSTTSSTINSTGSTPPHPSYLETGTRRSTMETLSSPQRQGSGPLLPERTSNHVCFTTHPPPPQNAPKTDLNTKLNPLRKQLLEKLGEEVSDHPQSQPGPPLQSSSGPTSSVASAFSTLLNPMRLEILKNISDNSLNNSPQPSTPSCSRKSTGSTLSPPPTPTASSHPKQKLGGTLPSFCPLRPRTPPQKSRSPPLANFELLNPPKPPHPPPPPPGRSSLLPTPPPSRSNDTSVRATPTSPPSPPPPPPSGRLNALPTPPLSASPASITRETSAPPTPSPPPLPPRPPSLLRSCETLDPKPQYQAQNGNSDTSIRYNGAPNSSTLPLLPPPPPLSLPISPTASETAASVYSSRAPRVTPNANASVTLPMSPTSSAVGRMDSLSNTALQSPVLIAGRPLHDPWLDDGRMVGSPLPLQYGLFGDHEHAEFRGRPHQTQFQSMHAINHQIASPFRSFTAPQVNISPYAHAQGPIQTQTQSQDTYAQDIQAHASVRRESYGILWGSGPDLVPGSDPLVGHGPVLPRPPAFHQQSLGDIYHTPAATAIVPTPDAWVPHVNQPMRGGNGREHHNGRAPGYTLPVSMRYDQGPPPAQPGPQTFAAFYISDPTHFGVPY